MRLQPEYQLQRQVCQYLKSQYPKVLFMSDTVAAVRLTIPQQVRNKAIQKEGFKCPDLLIFESRGGYHGLFIELKVKSPFQKSGEIYKNEHLEGQQRTIKQLNERGYHAGFITGFEEAKLIIDKYMKL